MNRLVIQRRLKRRFKLEPGQTKVEIVLSPFTITNPVQVLVRQVKETNKSSVSTTEDPSGTPAQDRDGTSKPLHG